MIENEVFWENYFKIFQQQLTKISFYQILWRLDKVWSLKLAKLLKFLISEIFEGWIFKREEVWYWQQIKNIALNTLRDFWKSIQIASWWF